MGRPYTSGDPRVQMANESIKNPQTSLSGPSTFLLTGAVIPAPVLMLTMSKGSVKGIPKPPPANDKGMTRDNVERKLAK